MKKILRCGYTTGACAAAAAKGAAQMFANQALATQVTINLPVGVNATFQLHGQSFSANEASCFVIKDAGDDPDVTNGAEVWATVSQSPHPHPGPPLEGEGVILITGGVGIGKVTKPGLAVPPGEWAINPVPRRMIEEAVCGVLSNFNLQPSTFNIAISIPDGEERAKKTLNQRLGIMGGLSILGTTGIVRPISAKAWTDTIDAALDVARACGCETVILSTGRTSEMAAQHYLNHTPPPLTGGDRGVGEAAELDAYPNIPPTLTLPRRRGGDMFLPEEAFIMMGDHVAYALRACAMRGFARPIIACQFAKLLKIACGHENTHAAASELDLVTLKGWAEEAGLSSDVTSIIANANTAREIAIATGFDMKLTELVIMRAEQATVGHASDIEPRFLVCGYDGNVVRS